MIKITDKMEVAKVRFVLAAIADKKHHGADVIKYVHIGEDGMMVCTDGHRAHLLQTEYPTGMYEVLKSVKNEVVLAPSTDYTIKDYPDYKRVIPSIDGLDPAVTAIYGDATWKTYTKFNRAHTFEEMTLDYQYFCDAVSCTENIYITGNAYSPVVFTGNGTTAVVMPCRM